MRSVHQRWQLGASASTIILIPDFNVGFSALAASYPRPQAQAAIWSIKNWIDDILIPGIEEAAREQAKEAFVGLYTDPETNSSLSIYVDEKPGLKISTWVSNGLDVIRSLRYQLSGYGIGTDLNFRLFPNFLYPQDGRTMGFAGTARFLTGDYPAWESIDGFTYGSIGIDNFVFEMDSDTGLATSIEPLAYQTTLVRQS